MLVGNESFLNSCASSTMIWSTPISEMVSMSSLTAPRASSLASRPSFMRSIRFLVMRSSLSAFSSRSA